MMLMMMVPHGSFATLCCFCVLFHEGVADVVDTYTVFAGQGWFVLLDIGVGVVGVVVFLSEDVGYLGQDFSALLMFSQQIRKLAHLFVVVFEVIYKCVGIDDNNKL